MVECELDMSVFVVIVSHSCSCWIVQFLAPFGQSSVSKRPKHAKRTFPSATAIAVDCFWPTVLYPANVEGKGNRETERFDSKFTPKSLIYRGTF